MTTLHAAVKAQKKTRKVRTLPGKVAVFSVDTDGPDKTPRKSISTGSAEDAMVLEEKSGPRKTPKEVLKELRERATHEAKPAEKADVQTVNELMQERRRRNEEAYCDKLRSQGKPIYGPQDVVALGFTLDPSWTQEDLQTRMLVGPVIVPLKRLQMKADDYHQTFVIPGRKAVVEIMAEAYRLFLLAMVPERRMEVFKVIREQVEGRLTKRLAEDVSFGSLFIRFVFTEFDDRKVHLYSRALDFAYSSNVSADAFTDWVKRLGGWESVRQEAAKAFNTSPDVLMAKKAKEANEKEAQALIERWRILRGIVGSVQIDGQLSKKLGNRPGKFLLEVTWIPDHHPDVDVYGGLLEVLDVLPQIKTVTTAVEDSRLQQATLEREQLLQIVERLEAEGYDDLDAETKMRYDTLQAVRRAIASGESNAADKRMLQAANDAPLKSFA